jgi:carboxymethylenebutenolidase
MHEEVLEFAVNGTPGTGFLVRPDSTEPAPGVIVIQEWWGLNSHIKDVTRRFAAAGFVALAPDLYHGKVVAEPNLAQKEMMALDRPRAIQEIVGAVTYLTQQTYVSPKKIGVTGFCMGGGLALHSAAHSSSIGAVAAFYGGGSPEASALSNNTAAILNIVGEKDSWVMGAITELQKGMDAYSFPHEFVHYPDAEHAFFNNDRPEVYKADAATDAWQRTLTWFATYLK